MSPSITVTPMARASERVDTLSASIFAVPVHGTLETRMKNCIIALSAVVAAISPASADVVTFQGGGNLTCTVVQETTKNITAILGSGLLTFDKTFVRTVT